VWRKCEYVIREHGAPRHYQEVHHANQKPSPRPRVLSRSVANVGKGSHRNLRSNAVLASCVGTRSSSRNSAAMIPVPVAPGADFKRCCMLGGKFDGSDRHYFFKVAPVPDREAAPGTCPASACKCCLRLRSTWTLLKVERRDVRDLEIWRNGRALRARPDQ